MNVSNYFLLPLTSLCWVGKAALQHEGDLHSSLEASRNSCGLMRMQVHGVVQHMKTLGLNYSSVCWIQESQALVLLLTGCDAVWQPTNSLFRCGKWGHLSLPLWWGSVSSHEPFGIRSSSAEIVLLIVRIASWKSPRNPMHVVKTYGHRHESFTPSCVAFGFVLFFLFLFACFWFCFLISEDAAHLCHVSSGSHGDYSS